VAAMTNEQRHNILGCVTPFKVICLSQPHQGKRYAMYTALWLAGELNVPYVLTTDSDTWIDKNAPFYLKTLLDEDDSVAAVTGLVKIYNVCNLLSLLIDMKYRGAFEIERAAQSYFNCVSCISGPLGMYRMSMVTPILEAWLTQTFCGQPATFGDDRHMTMKLLNQKGNKTLYTHKAICYTETPVQWSRWFTQQTRWGRSFFREYLLNIPTFYKISWWLVYDLTYLTSYSILLFAFSLIYFLQLSIPSLLLLMTSSVAIMFLRVLYLMYLERDVKYFLFTGFGFIYFICLLPLKLLSGLTVWFNGWGTSHRKKMVHRYSEAFVVGIWVLFLCSCIGHSIYRATTILDLDFTLIFCITILGVWLVLSAMILCYLVCCRKIFRTEEKLLGLESNC
jgi:hyaluronan synthase